MARKCSTGFSCRNSALAEKPADAADAGRRYNESMSPQTEIKTATSAAQSHVSSDAAVCGGKPCISGTRIRVWDIHVLHELRGFSPAEIIVQFPQLRMADVYAALAYYHDHRPEIDRQMREADAFVEVLQRSAEPSAFAALQEQGLNAPVSPR